MLESIKKIMEKSKEKGVDIIVATRMLIHEGKDNDTMEKALDLYSKVYAEVSYFHNKGDEESLAKVVELAELGKYEEVREFVKDAKGE